MDGTKSSNCGDSLEAAPVGKIACRMTVGHATLRDRGEFVEVSQSQKGLKCGCAIQRQLAAHEQGLAQLAIAKLGNPILQDNLVIGSHRTLGHNVL